MQFQASWTDDTVLRELGQRLKNERLRINLSQQQLAENAGVSRATVERAEAGHGLQTPALIRLLRALDLLELVLNAIPESGTEPIAVLEQETSRRKRATGQRKTRATEGGTVRSKASDVPPWGTR